MPFAGYENFDACVVDQTGKGHSKESAQKICGMLKKKFESRVKSTTRLDMLSTDGVERTEPNGPPTAFRIWSRGDNVTDHGPTVFSDRAAASLMAEQATRGNRYSIDVDHMSLDKSAPLENHAAVGWFSLDVRDGDLWAVDIEWVNDTVRAGLTKGAWKYMSPAYDVNEDGEVISFLNLSLTANPATHATTALASRGTKKGTSQMDAEKKEEKRATWADLKAAIDGDDENAKMAAYATIAAAFPEHSEPDGDEGEKKKDAEPEPEKKDAKKCADDEPEKKDSAAVIAAQDARIRKLEADAAMYQKERDDKERRELIAGREMSAELRKTLASKPLSTVRDICAALPVKTVRPISTESIQGTRGASSGQIGPRLDPETSRKIAERMGVVKREESVHWHPDMTTTRVFPAGVEIKKEVK